MPKRLRAGLCLAGAGVLAFGCSRPSPLLAPTPADLARVAPDSFLVALETSRGTVTLMAHRAWSPLGVDRMYLLLEHGFYDGARFFRVVPGFVVQWGLSGDSAINRAWDNRNLPDEPVRQSNTRGRISYARGGPNTRSVQLYINLASNARLDTTSTFGFPPLGEVRLGMELMDSMFASCPRGGAAAAATCPSQDSIRLQGSAYLDRVHPKLDYIRKARIVRRWR